MKRFIAMGGMSVLAVALGVGLTLAADGPVGPGAGGGQPGGPGGPGGQGMQHRGPPPLVPAIEHKLGKPLTEDQKTQIGEAMKAQFESIKANRNAFAKKIAEITGLSAEQAEQALPPPPPAGPGQGGPGMQGPQQGGPGQGGPGQGGPGMRGPGQGGPGQGGPGQGGPGMRGPGKRGPGQGGPGQGGPGQGGPGQGGPGQGGPGQGGPGQGGPGMGGQMPPPPGGMLVKRIEQLLGKQLTQEQMEQLRPAGEAHREAIKATHEAFLQKLAGITGLSAEDLKQILPAPHGPPPMPPQGQPKGPPKGPPKGSPKGPPPPPQGGPQQ